MRPRTTLGARPIFATLPTTHRRTAIASPLSPTLLIPLTSLPVPRLQSKVHLLTTLVSPSRIVLLCHKTLGVSAAPTHHFIILL
ncbi:hypothetical protein BCV69DRAFT_172733 [Microstroma glucosiphilum]|uniref:Uncharacterized protein n=1 Tax=Pseudomicrostroma glucosiphilum TaxID=1684307 RepID=A0A316U8M4_9BASI|nr:hypothetical protein BCV69DRAFT_172733 [Pseudomicrostroma glucosiphilum]PWN21522.1 hypothetical protein BCV69DRAFT_172733 [Pseudomicrostroma glucosiphilum]